MPTLFFALLTVLIVGVALAFPLGQALHGGPLYFINGFDEATYLQYHFSRSAQSVTRAGQFLVSAAHEAGLSGGWINLIFDVAAMMLGLWLTRSILLLLGYERLQANVGALTALLAPLFFTGANVLVRVLFNVNLSTGFVAWMTVPESRYLPLLRSPEPQFSTVLLLAGVWLSLRYRSWLPVIACVPFLYPFLAMPVVFVLLAIALQTRWELMRRQPMVAAAIAFGAVGMMVAAYHHLLVGPTIRQMLVQTHAPLLTFTGLAALVGYGLVRQWVPDQLRHPVLFLALSPWVATNLQILTGVMPQPNNFEQYYGVYCAALVPLFAVIHRTWPSRVALAGALTIFFHVSLMDYEDNRHFAQQFPLTPSLTQALREDSAHVVIDDLTAAARFNMLFARQPSTALGFERTFGVAAAQHLPTYVCMKAQMAQDGRLTPKLRGLLDRLDNAYAYGSQDFILIHIGRKTDFRRLLDPSIPATHCAPTTLHYVTTP